MRRFFVTLSITSLVLLTGCKTTEERAMERRQVDVASCRSYGFNPGTQPYASCLMQRDIAREQADANERTARRSRRCVNTVSNSPPAAGAASGFLTGFSRGLAC